MTVAASFAGWLAAGVVATMALTAWRALGSRMEAVARACHELRGPITAARLGLELGSRSGELTAARLRAIDTELGRATLALEDLAGVPAGRPPAQAPQAVDLRLLLADAVEAWRPGAAARGAGIELRWRGGPRPVLADPMRVRQAVGNLIANAIVHGRGEIEVRGVVLDRGARIEVIDDGPGLPATLAELARHARHGRGAHGRGLAIAAGIAAAQGGRLSAAPSPRGARLVLELPLVPGAGPGSWPEPRRRGPRHRRR